MSVSNSPVQVYPVQLVIDLEDVGGSLWAANLPTNETHLEPVWINKTMLLMSSRLVRVCQAWLVVAYSTVFVGIVFLCMRQ